jgi:siroheme synthase-like protein
MSPSDDAMAAYPLFLRLRGLPVLVVGGGPVACEKARTLHAAGARVHVVAPRMDPELVRLAGSAETRPFAPQDVDGKWLALAAATPRVNQQVREAGDARRVFVVAVDDVASCSAIGAAVLRRGGLTFAISSDGRAPALVALLRRAIDEILPADLEAWVGAAQRARRSWKSAGIPLAERRPLLLRALNSMYERGGNPP